MFFRLYLPPCSGRLRQPATIDPTLDLCTRYPLRLGGPRQCGIWSLPDTSTHGQHWESNPRPSDLESNALSTWPHAPKLTSQILTFGRFCYAIKQYMQLSNMQLSDTVCSGLHSGLHVDIDSGLYSGLLVDVDSGLHSGLHVDVDSGPHSDHHILL